MSAERTSVQRDDSASLTAPGLRLTVHAEPGGDTRVDLMDGERSVSRLWIIPLTLRIGAATVRMDGIGGVGTEEDCRHRGYARRVLEAAVEHMRQGDAALSMLYGIPNFYPQFGYTTAGPDHFIWLTRLAEEVPMPPGWRVRPFVPADLLAVRRLYEENTTAGVGCAVRGAEATPWRKLAEPEEAGREDCRVVEDRDGQVRGYAWHARWHWYVDMLEKEQPDALVFGEVMADGPGAADAILAVCRHWAVEEGARRSHPVQKAVLALPPGGPVAAGAMYQPAHFVWRFAPCGSCMARVLDVRRLLETLKPELARRLSAAGSHFAGALHFRTEIGDAVLAITPDGVVVGNPALPDAAAASETVEIRLPQATLARLALGAYPPDDLLTRLQPAPGEEVRRLLETLFPLRHPHLYLPDRF